MTEVPPIRREVTVELSAQAAFELFTAGIGSWWPVERHSVFGRDASVSFQGDELVETHDERRTRWGRVLEWVPGKRVSFTWHPGRGDEEQPSSQVSVSFEPDGDRTLVVLEHSGWQAFEDPQAARDEYDQGWPAVMASYAEASQGGDGLACTWVALQHRPGPAAPSDGSLFEAPGFAQHVEFLTRMREAGYLVAAGPMLDRLGEGMTILRLPGQDRLAEARRLATQDDASVKSGFFEVAVRPWRVVMADYSLAHAPRARAGG